MAKKATKKQAEQWRNRIVRTGEAPASEFKANEKNWRIHPREQREALRGVLGEVGWVTGVVTNKATGNVIDGHARIEEALKLGDETPVPFIEVELSEDEEAKILATFDPISAMAVADKEQLDALLRDVQTADAGVMQMLDDLAKSNGLDYGADAGASDADAEPQIDKADELQKKWGVERGQVWQLGAHRLMCGDSTDAGDVARLMGGEKADAVVTDPPYGMKAVSSSGVLKTRYGSDIAGDESTDIAIKVFKICAQYKVPQVWWGANYYSDCLPPSGFWVVWDKNNGGSDQADAELAWTNLKGVVRIFKQASEKVDRVHPTQKHPRLIVWCIEKCGNGEMILDPFSGSGTTIIACEQLGRKCRAMEISEAYTAVAIERWHQATGKTPTLASE